MPISQLTLLLNCSHLIGKAFYPEPLTNDNCQRSRIFNVQFSILNVQYLCATKLPFMRAVIQRVSRARVIIEGKIHSEIGRGLLVLLGIEDADTEEDIEWLSGKIVNLRIFDDAAGVMNESVKDKNGDIILVSQFTLHASTKKGNRPSYIKASKPGVAVPIYEKMIAQLTTDLGKPAGTGIFGADMKVELLNDGPVTIVMDTKDRE